MVSLDYYHNSYSACQLGNNCESLRQQLALEIQANCLPTNHDLLIVITTIKSAPDLEKRKVWRGLSNRIEATELITTNPKEKKTLFKTAVIATITMIILTVFLIL